MCVCFSLEQLASSAGCSESSYVFDELPHLVLRDDSVAVRVCLFVAVLEVVVRKLPIVDPQTLQDVSHQQFCLRFL